MQPSRTFRIFVSSTFSDLKAERNALQEKVFPRLRDLAAAHGCRFQAIDLRWGVSEEAALDQQTMKICLGEIERCQKVTPRPNFIILLGDRYGWRPLPYEIPAEEIEKIVPLVSEEDKTLLKQWYRRDDNAIPPVYLLQPRDGEFREYENWEKVEKSLRQAFLSIIEKLSLSPDAALKYTASATEQEIVAGALQVPDAQEHVFGFFREIEGLSEDESSKDYRDADAGTSHKQTELKERLRKQLPGNIHEYQATWQGEGPSLNHLDRLCEDVYADLSKVILSEISHLEAVDPLEKEIGAHADFGKERARVFVGRADILKTIADYLNSKDHHPLAVWGASGSGKSALMAKAAEHARESGKDVICRFIGATPESSNGRALLEGLCKQISRRYGADESTIPSEYKDLVKEFPKRMALATPDKPLVLFLDALDQLSDADNARNLVWLPRELPPNVHLIVSTLDPGECLQTLQNRLPAENCLEVQPMSVDDGKTILGEWLKEVNRKLQDNQIKYLLGKFKDCGLPLYLKLAFEEARLWKSYDPLPQMGDDIPGILRDLFDRLSQESNHGKMLVLHSLGHLAAAKNGLSEDELLDVLSLDSDVLTDFQRRSPKSPDVKRLPVVVWSRLYFDLEPYLTERSADGTALLTFYHRQLNEFATTHYLNPDFHQRLAAYFTDQSLYAGQDGGDVPNLRRLSELPYQEAHGGLSDELRATLTEFKFLEAKVSAQGVQPLIDDYDLVALPGLEVPAASQKGLRLVQAALRLSAYVLTGDKSQLAPQLTGRLLSFQEPEIKTLLERIREIKKDPWLRPLTLCFTPPGGHLVRTLVGHTGHVNAVAVTPDGRRAVSGSRDSTLKVWDLEHGTELATLHGHTGSIYAVAITPDGHRAISGSEDKTLKVWDLECGTELATLRGHKGSIYAVAITPDGHRAVSGSWDKTLKVWDLERSTKLATLRGHTREVWAVAVTPDGQRAVSGSDDRTLKVWDLERGTKLATLQGHTDWVRAVAVTPDGCRAISGSADTTLKVWDLERGTKLATLQGHTKGVWAVAVTPDGRRAISGSSDHTLKVWDISTEFTLSNADGLNAGLERGAVFATLRGHTREVWAVAVTPDGRRAVSGSYDNTLKVWDISTEFTLSSTEGLNAGLERGAELATLKGHTDSVQAVAVTPDGRRAVSGSSDHTLKVWDLERGMELATLQGNTNAVYAVAVTPDGHRAISASWEGTLRVWALERGTILSTLQGHTRIVETVVVTSDGRRAVSGSRDKTLKVWNLEQGTELATLRGHTSEVSTVAVAPDGRRAVSGSWDQTLKVWDISTEFTLSSTEGLNAGLECGIELATLKGHTGSVQAVTVTPDGRRAVSGSSDKTLKVWDLERGTELVTLQGHTERVTAVAVTPDGRRAVSGSNDHTLKVWDLERGTELATLHGHTDVVDAVAVTADGNRAVSGSVDQTLKVWDLTSSKLLATFSGDAGIWVCAVAADGSTIVAGEASGRVYFLRLENVIPDLPVVTAWLRRDSSIAFGCPHCRTWSEIPESALGNEIPCPRCGKHVKLNSFTINADWRPIAKAWRGEG